MHSKYYLELMHECSNDDSAELSSVIRRHKRIWPSGSESERQSDFLQPKMKIGKIYSFNFL
jgi:hypothetical protein